MDLRLSARRSDIHWHVWMNIKNLYAQNNIFKKKFQRLDFESFIVWSKFRILGDCFRASHPPAPWKSSLRPWNPLLLTNNSRTTHQIWHNSFSMIESARIKNWLPQLISRLQRFSLSFLLVSQNKICLIRINTKRFR